MLKPFHQQLEISDEKLTLALALSTAFLLAAAGPTLACEDDDDCPTRSGWFEVNSGISGYGRNVRAMNSGAFTAKWDLGDGTKIVGKGAWEARDHGTGTRDAPLRSGGGGWIDWGMR